MRKTSEPRPQDETGETRYLKTVLRPRLYPIAHVRNVSSAKCYFFDIIDCNFPTFPGNAEAGAKGVIGCGV